MLASPVLGGCLPDLGECDEAAARTIVYSSEPDGTRRPAYAGQALIVESCGYGSFCHTEGIDPADRFGAPHGLDFDLRPVVVSQNPAADEEAVERLRRAQQDVYDHRQRIYALVQDGLMPPSVPDGAGGHVGVDADLLPDVPAIDTREGRDILKNWLACRVPVVDRVANCVEGLASCDGVCVDLSSSQGHCGQCGRACGTGQSCVDGACQCDAGLTACGAKCVDTSTDFRHCGGCDQACGAGEVCAGMCLTGGCPGGTTDCGGSCVDTSTSAQHCGGCNVSCPAGQGCRGGACGCSDPALTLCMMMCVDTQTDPAHCGGCGTACPAGGGCDGGGCVCLDGRTLCGGACVDTQTNPRHCGGCGVVCGMGEVCEAGACVSCGTGTSFASDVQPIFSTRCDGMQCHVGARRPAAGMSLESGQSYGNLVGVPADDCNDGRLRVAPFDPDNSYLLHKLRYYSRICAGNSMPLNDPPLPDAEIAEIERWICGGALNN